MQTKSSSSTGSSVD